MSGLPVGLRQTTFLPMYCAALSRVSMCSIVSSICLFCWVCKPPLYPVKTALSTTLHPLERRENYRERSLNTLVPNLPMRATSLTFVSVVSVLFYYCIDIDFLQAFAYSYDGSFSEDPYSSASYLK